jgi:hypothetical protein
MTAFRATPSLYPPGLSAARMIQARHNIAEHRSRVAKAFTPKIGRALPLPCL